MGNDVLSDKERIAVNEIEITQVKDDLKEIKDKLDELLQLKAQGMGAIGLISLIVGSGFIGLVIMLFNMFKSHV